MSCRGSKVSYETSWFVRRWLTSIHADLVALSVDGRLFPKEGPVFPALTHLRLAAELEFLPIFPAVTHLTLSTLGLLMDSGKARFPLSRFRSMSSNTDF